MGLWRKICNKHLFAHWIPPLKFSKLHYFSWTVVQELLGLKITWDANPKKKGNSSKVGKLKLSGGEATRWSLQQMPNQAYRPWLCCLYSLRVLGILRSYRMKLQSFVMLRDTYREMSEDHAYHVLYVALRTSCRTSPGLHVVSEARFGFSANISLFFFFFCQSHHPLVDLESAVGKCCQ